MIDVSYALCYSAFVRTSNRCLFSISFPIGNTNPKKQKTKIKPERVEQDEKFSYNHISKSKIRFRPRKIILELKGKQAHSGQSKEKATFTISKVLSEWIPSEKTGGNLHGDQTSYKNRYRIKRILAG